jgi:SAM-dependent methyltransferase
MTGAADGSTPPPGSTKPLTLVCSACGYCAPQRNSPPTFIRPQERDVLDAFAHRYRQARLAEGWRPLPPAARLSLPDGTPAGYPRLYWQVRRQTYAALVDLLTHSGPDPAAGPVADLGAGVGWLSHRLSGVGYRALAVDASADPDFGLGAADIYAAQDPDRLLAVRGDLEHPPLQRASLSLVIFNASLHYAQDLSGTLARAATALRRQGRLLVLDTPITPRPSSGSPLGDRHLGRDELTTAIRHLGLHPRWLNVRRGPRWWWHQTKMRLKGGSAFSFPILVATRDAA